VSECPSSILPNPALYEDSRTAGIDFNQDGYQHHDRQIENDHDGGKHNICRPFGKHEMFSSFVPSDFPYPSKKQGGHITIGQVRFHRR
jgi:hypothetical protein